MYNHFLLPRLGIHFVFMFRVCLFHTVLSVSCSPVVTFWERALGFLVCYVFVTFPYGIMGHVLYLILSIPDLCLFL